MIYIFSVCISMEFAMKVSKWGNSLAIRLPSDLVEKLGVSEGDEVYAVPGLSEEQVTLKRKPTLEEMWAKLDDVAKRAKVPDGFKFDRDEVYADHADSRWKKDE
jgi:antitoxin MazE